jgi:hypothetical protein
MGNRRGQRGAEFPIEALIPDGTRCERRGERAVNTFTDEDLKRFKACMIEMEKEKFTFFDFDIPALLARLEAAEKVCTSCEMEMMEKYYDGESLKAWRKAAGK